MSSKRADRPALHLLGHVMAAGILFILGALFFGGLLHHHGSPRVNLAQTIYTAIVVGVGWSPPLDFVAREAWRSAVVKGAADAALALRANLTSANGTNASAAATAAVTAAAVRAGEAADAAFGLQSPVGTGTKAKLIMIAMLLFNVVVVVLIARGLALFSASAAVKRALLKRRASLKSIRVVPQASSTFVAAVATFVVVPSLWLIFAAILHAVEREPGSSAWGYLDSLAFVIFTTFSVAMPDPVPRSGGGHAVVAILCVLNAAIVLSWLGVFASHVVSKRDAAASVPTSKEVQVVLEDLGRVCMHPHDASTLASISLELVRILRAMHPTEKLSEIFGESHGHPVEVLPARTGARSGTVTSSGELPHPGYESDMTDGHGHHWQAPARAPRFKTSTPPPIRTKFDDPDPAIDYELHKQQSSQDGDFYGAHLQPQMQERPQPDDPQGYYEFERSRPRDRGGQSAASQRQVLPDLRVHLPPALDGDSVFDNQRPPHHSHPEHRWQEHPQLHQHQQHQGLRQHQNHHQPEGQLDPLAYYSNERERSRRNLFDPSDTIPSHHVLPELHLQTTPHFRQNYTPLPPLRHSKQSFN